MGMLTLSMTPKGLAMVETLLPRVVAHWNALLGDFSHLEIKLLIKLLSRLTAATEGKRDQDNPRPRKRREKESTGVRRRSERREHRHRREIHS